MGVRVGVPVAVGVAVGVRVAVAVGVCVGVCVSVGVEVEVGVGVGTPTQKTLPEQVEVRSWKRISSAEMTVPQVLSAPRLCRPGGLMALRARQRLDEPGL